MITGRRLVFEVGRLFYVNAVMLAIAEVGTSPLKSQQALERRAAQYLTRTFKRRNPQWRTRLSHAAYHVMSAIDAKVIDPNAY